MGYSGSLPGTGRFLLTPHCEVIPMVLEGLEQLAKGGVGDGGGGGVYSWEKQFHSFLFSPKFVILSVYEHGVDITCHKQNNILEIAL